MIKITDGDSNFLLSEGIALEDTDILPIEFAPRGLITATSVNELGKQLLKASGDGDLEQIQMLMSKGAPFTADWLGTSPLHLAAQNNHLEVCEVLLKAGISRDARTKVDRTPLHIAAYEGHIDIVDCLLKSGADCDSRDMLQNTPLHWAAQNGHAEIAAMLIRYGASTNLTNKFELTPIDLAGQINRQDIVNIIQIAIRDPLIATQHLQLEMTDSNETVDLTGQDIEIPIPETVLLEEVDSENSLDPEIKLPEEATPINQDPLTESMKYLQEHGITMLPNDDTNILSAVMETGHSVVLTDVGKQVLNSIKEEPPVIITKKQQEKPTKENSLTPIKVKKVITITPAEFLAMTNTGQLNNVSKQTNLVQISKNNNVKRVVMKKSKVFPMNSLGKVDSGSDLERVKKQLADALRTIEMYKVKLRKKEAEVENYKMQLKLILDSQ
ncbi:GA-binding protein subunit beta-1 [Onthophagus taurus]|uniref:GA-binding protein subunit beta-1 n=1 Tax=Onthophagus taurus TaxID=166361 RepID=UPI000C20AEAF|nr:GA-binding protein subunit beta-1 [Onthophagus taurus]